MKAGFKGPHVHAHTCPCCRQRSAGSQPQPVGVQGSRSTLGSSLGSGSGLAPHPGCGRPEEHSRSMLWVCSMTRLLHYLAVDVLNYLVVGLLHLLLQVLTLFLPHHLLHSVNRINQGLDDLLNSKMGCSFKSDHELSPVAFRDTT